MNTNSPYQFLQPEDVIEVAPPTVDSQMRVIEALAKMNQKEPNQSTYRRYSYVLVVEKLQLVGIITERDIVKLTSAETNLVETKVDAVMTKQLITLKKSEFLDVQTILAILRQKKIRHLPIVDAHGQLEGIVTVNTISRALHPSNMLKFRRVDEAMTLQVLEAPETSSVLSLSQMMADNRSSCVVIVSPQQPEEVTELAERDLSSLSIPVGIVTERDIVQFQILGLDLINTIAQTVMSTPLVCVKTTDSLMQVHQQMDSLRVRRLVVIGKQGELQGIINQYDMLKVLDPAELFGIIGTLQQELEEKTNQLQQEKELAQVTLQSIGDAVITTDVMGKIVNFNPMAERLTGWRISEAKHQPLTDIFRIINEHTREPVPNPVEKVLRENRVFGLANHTILIARDETEYSIENSAAPIRDRLGRIIGTVIVFHDVTESRDLTNQLSWQATHDALTCLYNRREFEKKVAEAIAIAQNEGHQHALCYLDLDRFKIVNDTCGHAAGDELLRQVTQLLNQRIRSADILARLGGDEFGFLLYQCPLEVATKIANNLRQWIEDFHFTWEGQAFAIGVSIGLVEINSNTENLSSLLNAADAACYAAKANGRNCVHVYQDNDAELAKNLGERQWIIRLNQALSENRFCLYSQKIVSIKDEEEVDRYEILLRLRDEQGQVITAGAFIPAAERYDLMPAIDRWVINHFLADYERHYQQGGEPKKAQSNSLYAINLSGASISSQSFRLFLKEQFTRFQIAPSTICFEITETVAISNLATAAKFIQELKELGCSIALDDFGSGMSSLNYLKNLSVDYLKIDGSFVKNIVEERVDRATVEYFNQIAQIMQIKTVAEFVEDKAILQKLQEIGIDYAQGYGIARPIPLVLG
ncbi:putative Diguanylate cyclase [Hyella patelloides LEGE 07179]|uniref:Putative Diguanylate cyclase n=1 Tax=Hyella patelloides LEGE 07179 TaxID=945734 RepID=A0A563VWX5_9CYAN|nr:EAL domain-containing protein [Hyella patelloides]VEP15926.1 putative Diguanylate cyclase [Hyella patelloides LEGE 07179]